MANTETTLFQIKDPTGLVVWECEATKADANRELEFFNSLPNVRGKFSLIDVRRSNRTART